MRVNPVMPRDYNFDNKPRFSKRDDYECTDPAGCQVYRGKRGTDCADKCWHKKTRAEIDEAYKQGDIRQLTDWLKHHPVMPFFVVDAVYKHLQSLAGPCCGRCYKPTTNTCCGLVFCEECAPIIEASDGE